MPPSTQGSPAATVIAEGVFYASAQTAQTSPHLVICKSDFISCSVENDCLSVAEDPGSVTRITSSFFIAKNPVDKVCLLFPKKTISK